MIILTLRTDKQEAEIGLFDGQTQLVYETWEAHRQLAETIHQKIQQLLENHMKGSSLHTIEGIVIYEGPGSFTGLRIGISVANALAYSLEIPIIGTTDENWLKQGITLLQNGESDKQIVPEYGAPVHTTIQKK